MPYQASVQSMIWHQVLVMDCYNLLGGLLSLTIIVDYFLKKEKFTEP